MNRLELEEKLISFSEMILHIQRNVPQKQASLYLNSQIVHSSTSAALKFGEHQGTETRKDFLHNMKHCLKELCETHVYLKNIERATIPGTRELKKAIIENNELMVIFTSSIKSSLNNYYKEQRS